MLGYLNQDSNLDCGLAHLNFCKEDYGEGPQAAGPVPQAPRQPLGGTPVFVQ